LAKCRLVTDDKIFLDLYKPNSDLKLGLEELRAKVSKDHALSTFFIQPMPGYPEIQNKIWKWDFAPENTTGSTRKGWRLFARVEFPSDPAEPVIAVPFLCFDRSDAPTGNPAMYIAKALKKYATHVVVEKRSEEEFKHQLDSGKTRSLCLKCFATVIVSEDVDQIAQAESSHSCGS
jgi:hypothetical protein